MAHRGTLLDSLFHKATQEDGHTTAAKVLFSHKVTEVMSATCPLPCASIGTDREILC